MLVIKLVVETKRLVGILSVTPMLFSGTMFLTDKTTHNSTKRLVGIISVKLMLFSGTMFLTGKTTNNSTKRLPGIISVTTMLFAGTMFLTDKTCNNTKRLLGMISVTPMFSGTIFHIDKMTFCKTKGWWEYDLWHWCSSQVQCSLLIKQHAAQKKGLEDYYLWLRCSRIQHSFLIKWYTVTMKICLVIFILCYFCCPSIWNWI